MCEMLRAMIEKNPDYRVLWTTEAKRGMSIIRKHMPDAIILDIMMPKISGLELLSKLKQHPLTMHIPVLMLTGDDTPEHLHSASEGYAETYLTKPIGRKDLMRSLEHAILYRRIQAQEPESDLNESSDLANND